MLQKLILVLALLGWIVIFWNEVSSSVIKEEGKSYIVDREGTKWDVTQAESLGFQPEKFQYGIGKNAFTPLDDSSLSPDNSDVPPHVRVIGISEGSESKAYSVPKLRGHEIANSEIGSKPIAAAY